MQDYVRSSIKLLNDKTKELNNLNELGIYLSKQVDSSSLQILKLIILASETKKLNKKFDINHIIPTPEEVYTKQQNIAGNLSMNPQRIALDLFEYISKNYPIDWNFKCYGIYSIFDLWLISFERMGYDVNDLFYQRYDMLDKKLDILDFAIDNGLLQKKQVSDLIEIYKYKEKYAKDLTTLQKQRITYRINQLIQYYKLHDHITSIKGLSKKAKEKEHEEIDRIMKISRNPANYIYKSCRENAKIELENFKMINDDCSYIYEQVPRLIKQKTIK